MLTWIIHQTQHICHYLFLKNMVMSKELSDGVFHFKKNLVYIIVHDMTRL